MTIDTGHAPVSRAWLTGGIGGTVVAILVGTAAVWHWAVSPAPQSQAQAQTYQHQVARVELDLAAGTIALAAGPDAVVQVHRVVHWSVSRPVVREVWSGNTLRVTAQCPREHSACAVDYTLQVPANTVVQARTGAGDLAIRDLTDEVRLDTGAGRTRVDDVRGDLWIHSGEGDITATGLRSRQLQLDTGSGRVDLRYAVSPATVRVTAGDGDISVTVPPVAGGTDAGYRVTARTEDGEQRVGVREDSSSPRTITADTGSGNVTVGYA